MAGYKILIIDDHHEWRAILKDKIDLAIKGSGEAVDIQTLDNFIDAWETLGREDWDLLVSDIGLGDEKQSQQMLGKRLAEYARELCIPSILVSGTRYVTPGEVSELFRKYKVADFFWKPSFDDVTFINSVQEAIKRPAEQVRLPEEGKEKPPAREDRYALRTWWHDILRQKGRRYACYAFFLGLPGDTELDQYLAVYRSDLELIARGNWLIITVSRPSLQGASYEMDLSVLIHEDIERGYPLKIAELFEINIKKFPCLVFFTDVRSSRRLVYPLKNLKVEEISEEMRFMLAAIQAAAKENRDPLDALYNQQKQRALLRKGKVLASELGDIAGRTLEKLMERVLLDSSKWLGR